MDMPVVQQHGSTRVYRIFLGGGVPTISLTIHVQSCIIISIMICIACPWRPQLVFTSCYYN